MADGDAADDLFDAAVVMPTLLRPTLGRAVRSVFGQDFKGRIQLLIGIDKGKGRRDQLQPLLDAAPPHVRVTVFDPGYSTSRAHGGLHRSHDGGALRTILSYLAHSPRIAYLDDDNWWAPNHLSSLAALLKEADWAWSLRYFVRAETGEALAVDRWESVGPDAGFFRETHGGFVDPNCLMLDTARCEPVLRQWSIPLAGSTRSRGADRNVFSLLRRNHKGRGSGQASCYYVMNPSDGAHQRRVSWITAQRVGAFDGYRLFGQGRYREALSAFEELYRIAPPGILGGFWVCAASGWVAGPVAARTKLRNMLKSVGAPTGGLKMTAGVLLGEITPDEVLAMLAGDMIDGDRPVLAFFAGQVALWDHDHGSADLLLRLAASMEPATPETRTAATQRTSLNL